MDERPIIVFAKSLPERDYLRRLFPGDRSGVFSFEKEGICFDNLRSINPRAVVVRTDTQAVAWRFVFAIHALRANTQLVMITNELDVSSFNLYGLNGQVRWLPNRGGGERGFIQTFRRIVSNAGSAGSAATPKLLVGRTEAIRRINAILPRLRSANDPVLITGERGTGKELLARLIASGASGSQKFIKIDCAALPSKNSPTFFSPGEKADPCFVETLNQFRASGSGVTILLDKIDRLGKKSQREILLLLENQSNGAADDRRFNLRCIATTEADLQHLVDHNKFLKELFYRLNVIPVHLPALRERGEDIPLLADYLSICACDALQKGFTFLNSKTVEQLYGRQWPGNIDELESVVRRFVVSGEQLPLHALERTSDARQSRRYNLFYQVAAESEPTSLEIRNCLAVSEDLSLKHICDRFAFKTEKKLIQKALESTNWNRKKAAALLNISYKSMLNKITLYEIV